MRVARQPKVEAHWLHGIELALLGCTTNMFSKPDFGRSASAANVLGTTQSGTLPCLLGAGHTVYHPRGVTAEVVFDVIGIPCEITGVSGAVL